MMLVGELEDPRKKKCSSSLSPRQESVANKFSSLPTFIAERANESVLCVCVCNENLFKEQASGCEWEVRS
jgi:hypothetical protein